MRAIAILALALALLPVMPAAARQDPQRGLPPDPRAVGRLEAEERQMLAGITRNAATAARLGAVAGARLGGSPLAELGQAMALTNSGLEQQLAQVAGPENMPLRERADHGRLERLQALSRSDRHAFSREMVAWIVANYPDTIRNMEELGRRDGRYAALAEAALPPLRQQLSAAQDLTQAAMEGTGPRPRPSRD